MEKTLRVLSGDEEEGGHSHSHSHSHSIPHKDAEPTSVTSGIEKSSSPNGLKQRREDKTEVHGHDAEPEKSSQGPSKLSAYLNLFGDFVHNMYAPFACSQRDQQLIYLFLSQHRWPRVCSRIIIHQAP